MARDAWDGRLGASGTLQPLPDGRILALSIRILDRRGVLVLLPVRRSSPVPLLLVALGMVTAPLATSTQADVGSWALPTPVSTAPGVTPFTPPPGPGDPAWPRTAFRPAIVAYGEPVTLTVSGSTPGARTDAFVHTPREVATLTGTLDARGSVSWTFPGTSNAFVQARVGDVWNTELLPLRVIRQATLGVRERSGRYRFQGSTRPPTTGLQVTVAKVLEGGRVAGIAATRTDASGAYAVTTRLSPGTSLYYVVTPSTAELVGAHSRLYGLRVPRPGR